MSSYLITGASRGLGFEFVRHLAQNPDNTVIGLVRDKEAADSKAKAEGLHNFHMVEAQYTDLGSLKVRTHAMNDAYHTHFFQKAAEVVKDITAGALDYLVNNAAIISHVSGFKSLGDFDNDFETLEKDLMESLEINLLGVIKTIHAFLPLIHNGKGKKVIAISTGMADIDLINATEVAFAAPYSISKGAVNVAIAKYNALYNKEGILFLAVSPGYVSTERNLEEPTPEDAEKAAVLVGKFVEYAPHFQRPLTPEESVTAVLSVMDKASIANGDGGAFISHLGNKQWL
ncbi:Short-chain dehydrogenase/reductase SDR [Penicillium cf. griseofulvum]|uniref:Short-chain dehydrogenase/reductase SDR n=1 Tax=Penicillium cf. griseofulvum TaxID=2972120 RepID=A0A9W9MRS9_9EURO|nr:Short-chain dehydrogenase/reductase SDR [Penicillium cf. griseofulvum]KAJ5440651.1 Short-chain dehydrogenase/reductase SDR [Penicillium cf. griseofulvum]KAJ5448702.1 Short-chain dehydrogenase/reductase SDR [Penicillium cf. griseofulvum]